MQISNKIENLYEFPVPHPLFKVGNNKGTFI
jgi:hypothetical protein